MVALNIMRLQHNERTCSGDYIDDKDKKLPGYYLDDEGNLLYIICYQGRFIGIMIIFLAIFKSKC